MRLAERLGRAANLRTLLSLVVAVTAGLAIGFLLVPRAKTPADRPSKMPAVRVLGRALVLNDAAAKLALERVRKFASGLFTLNVPGEPSQSYRFSRFGAKIDKVRLSQLVRDARDPTSPLRRVFHAEERTTPLDLPVPVVLDPHETLSLLLTLKDEFDRLPVDARLDLEKRKVIPEVNGRQLDVDKTFANIQAAVQKGTNTATVAFEVRKPKRLSAELEGVRFDEVLGYFETPYNRANRYKARTFNLRLAASKLDGYVLLPGEIFDFNEVVGPRDEANVYKVAPVIAEGELVDGIGGGTCQISGTLHGAAFFAGLEIVERYPHTRPSSYIKMGLDATVVYPTINFRLRNSFDFPVVLHQTVKNGSVRAEVLGPKRTSTVTMIRRIDEAMPYEEVERPDKSLPSGTRVLDQRGVAGFKLHRYRIVRTGVHAVRERWDDVYPPTAQIVRVGTGEAVTDDAAKKDDRTPEYVADELLIVTQGLDVDDNGKMPKGGAMREWREPGAYGEYGWTKKAGMPFWETSE